MSKNAASWIWDDIDITRPPPQKKKVKEPSQPKKRLVETHQLTLFCRYKRSFAAAGAWYESWWARW